ncbi:MAG: ZIP family metal transporter [Actinomycetota bacterium]|nr:ZIP family metal transporter [Actinomycetota bacterium]
MNALGVFLVALGTALATGLGVFPVLAVRGKEKLSIALSSALAAGFMLGASIGLFYEGGLRSWGRTVVGALAGVVFIFAASKFLSRFPHAHVGQLKGARGLTAVLIIGVMTVHSFTEGIAVGVALAGQRALGILIAIAIAVHNIPEGVAISLSLVPHGEKARNAAFWSIFSSLPQPLMAVPAFIAVRAFAPLLPAGLGFAGGAMVWMVATQLVRESMESGRTLGTIAIVVAAALMIALEIAIGF